MSLDEKLPNKGKIILSIILGLAIIGGAIYIYNDLSSWEQTGGSRSMPRAILWLYELGGAWLPSTIIGLFSLICFNNAYKFYKQESEA